MQCKDSRIRTEFCVGEGKGECVGGGHRRAVGRMVDCLDIFKVTNGCIRLRSNYIMFTIAAIL